VADSKAVAKALDGQLRESFWPLLRARGFAHAGRTARLWLPHAVCVVSVRLLGADHYAGGAWGQRSFTINLGVWLPYVPPYQGSVRLSPTGKALPQIGECLFETGLRDPRGEERWFHVSDSGDDVAVPVIDAARLMEDRAPAWFADRHDVHQHLELARNCEDVAAAAGSPFHLYNLGMIAREAGRANLAASALREFLAKTEGFDDSDRDIRELAAKALAALQR